MEKVYQNKTKLSILVISYLPHQSRMKCKFFSYLCI